MSKTKAMVLVLAVFLMFSGSAFAVLKGDVNGVNGIELGDVILTLKVCAGIETPGVLKEASINNDDMIGLKEAIYDLRVLAGISNPGGDFTNTLGMTFKLIPAGTFIMGSPTDEPKRDNDEIQHQVSLTNAFYIQITETTQDQWQAVTGSNPSYFKGCGGDCPVEYVSWNDVQTFITAMNQRGEGIYRLPTEAEWEYAARAGSTTAFYNGVITYVGQSPVDPNLDVIGWYVGNSTVTYMPNASGKGTHPVAQKQYNVWGIYDMSGNVFEWCQDCIGSYPTTAVTDPTGPSTGSYHVYRGGGWDYGASFCRSANRSPGSPDGRVRNVGFRLARSIGQ